MLEQENKQTILHLIKANAICTAANLISANYFALIESTALGVELVRKPLEVFMPLSHFIVKHMCSFQHRFNRSNELFMFGYSLRFSQLSL